MGPRVKLKRGPWVRVQVGAYTLLGGDPQLVGDVTEIRDAGHRIVRVVLRVDVHGGRWLVELKPPPQSSPWPRLVGGSNSLLVQERRWEERIRAQTGKNALSVARILRMRVASRNIALVRAAKNVIFGWREDSLGDDDIAALREALKSPTLWR